MSFDDPSLWTLRYLQSFTSANTGLYYPPIPSFDTLSISKRITRIKVSSSTAKDTWVWAGYFSQMVDAGGVISAVRNQRVKLKEDNVIVWDAFTPYFLRVRFHRHITQATVSIYDYALDPETLSTINGSFPVLTF